MTSKLDELSGAMLTVAMLLQADERLRDNDILLYKAFEAVELHINIKSKGWEKN